MGTIPTPPTFAPGDTAGVAGKLNQLRDAINFWASPPRCYAYSTVTTTLTTATDTAITLGGELYDVVQSGDSPMHDNVTANTRITFRTAGTYEICGAVRFNTNATGVRQGGIRLNGTTFLIKNQQSAVSGAGTDCALPTIPYVFAIGDYIELMGYQTSGANLGVVTAPETTFLRAKLVAS